MKRRVLIAAVLMVAACGNKKDDPSLVELASLRDKMCACKDKGCADAVNSEVDAFLKRDRARFDSMPPDTKQQSAKLEDEQYQCWKKLR
jgi:hypothetical protein